MPVWTGFGPATFAPAIDPKTGNPYTYAKTASSYARYVAICPPRTKRGARISGRDAPLPKSSSPLHWDTALGYRVR